MKKIDIHCHTSPRKIKGVPHSDASINAIQTWMIEYDVETTVLLATYFPHKGSGISNYRLLNWINGLGVKFIMFGSLDFNVYFYQGFNELEELARYKYIRGIKIYTCYQDIDINSNNFKQVMELAQDNNLPVMFHTGHSYASQRKYGKSNIGTPYSASTLEPVAKEFPTVKFIFSHMSKPFFHEIVEVCQNNDNVWTDMSGIIDSVYDVDEIPICMQEIETFLKKCGDTKLLWGTDFPVQTHHHSVQFIMKQNCAETSKEKIFYSNAHELLRL